MPFRNSLKLGALLAAGCVSACSTAIRFSADTTIAADGSVFRTTRLAISGGSETDERVAHYELLPGGSWVNATQERPPVDENEPPARVYNRIYAVTRDFARGEAIGSDFRRLGFASNRAAQNAVLVRKRNFWIVETYQYREVFSDIPTPESVRRASQDVYALFTETYANQLADVVGVPAAEAETRFRSLTDPIYDAFIAFVLTECFRVRDELFNCSEAAESDESLAELVSFADDPEVFLNELERLFPAPAGVDRDDWLDRLESEVVDAVDIDELLDDPEYEEFLERAAEGFFGAHSLAIFEIYPFALSLRLPGKIVATNATDQQGDLLRWEFDNENFIFAPYTLHATSRVVHIDRLIVFFWVIGVLAVIGLWYWRQQWRKRNPA